MPKNHQLAGGPVIASFPPFRDSLIWTFKNSANTPTNPLALYCTFTAIKRKSLIINGAGEGNRTLISGLGSPHSTTEPHPLIADGYIPKTATPCKRRLKEHEEQRGYSMPAGCRAVQKGPSQDMGCI